MKLSSKYFLPLLLVISGSVIADVNLKVGQDISLLAVNGKEIDSDSFFSAKKTMVVKNGLNQVLVQLNAEFVTAGESEFESSDTHVVLFSAKDTGVLLTAPEIKKASQLKKFNSGKQWALTSTEGQVIQYDSAVLKKDGFQLARNFEHELQDFNKTNNPAALKGTVINTKPSTVELNKVIVESDKESLPMAEAMLRYWYMQADENARKKFKAWASDK